MVILSVLFPPKRLEGFLCEKRLRKAILWNSRVVIFLLVLKILFLYIVIQEEQNNFTAVEDKKYDLKDFSKYYKNFWRSQKKTEKCVLGVLHMNILP